MKKIEEMFNAVDEQMDNMKLENEGEDFSIDDENDPVQKIKGNEVTLLPSSYEAIGDKEDEKERVFYIDDLKKDFLIAKRNLKALIVKGQTLLTGVNALNLEEISGSGMVGIAQLFNSVTTQVGMLVTMYKDISEIEKNRKPDTKETMNNTTVQGNLTQNVVFSGSNAELLEIMKKAALSKQI